MLFIVVAFQPLQLNPKVQSSLPINETTTQDSNSKYESCVAQLYPKVVDKKSISSGLIQTPSSKLKS